MRRQSAGRTARRIIALVCGLAAVATLAGCSDSKELDRSKAEAVLTANNLHVQVMEYDGLGVLQCLQNMGYLHFNAIFALVNIDLTDRGTSLLQHAEASSQQMGVYGVALTLRHTIPFRLQAISGISDRVGDVSGATKTVDFTGTIDFAQAAMDAPARTCLDATGSKPVAATAAFKHFDDGWRLQSFQLPTFHVPLLTSSRSSHILRRTFGWFLGKGALRAHEQPLSSNLGVQE